MALDEYVRAARAARTAEDRLITMLRAIDALKPTLRERAAAMEACRQQAAALILACVAQADALAAYHREREGR